jgi:hypothetical protein
LTLVQRILRNPNYPGIPGGIDTCSKVVETHNYPGIPGSPGGILEELTLVPKMLSHPKLPRNSW